jgi:hypothetical protein
MKTNKIIMLLMMLLLSAVASAQDMIISYNADTLRCKVKEVGSVEVKYIRADYPADILFTMDTEKIQKLIFENGQELTFIAEIDNPTNYLQQNKNALKIDFLAPLTGNTTLAYEYSLSPGKSMEGTLGIIGMGVDTRDNNPRGMFMKYGIKFIKSPDFYVRNMRYAHILKGAYIKPEIGLGYFTSDNEDYSSRYPDEYTDTKRIENYSLMLQLVLGKQWVINDIFLVDFYAGAGYGFDNQEGGYYYGYAIISDEAPLSLSAGLKIGILF